MNRLHGRLNQCESLRHQDTLFHFSIHFIIEYLFCWFVIVLQVVNSKELSLVNKCLHEKMEKDLSHSLSECELEQKK